MRKHWISLGGARRARLNFEIRFARAREEGFHDGGCGFPLCPTPCVWDILGERGTAKNVKAQSKNVSEHLNHISEGLRPLAVAVGSLIPDAANARRHDPRNLDAIKASLARWGQRTPLVVRQRDNVVLKGNGTLEAAKALDWAFIAALPVEDDGAESIAYAIADNRSAELAAWDDETLASLLQNLDEELRDLAGFSGEELDEILKGLEPEPEIVEDEAPEPPADPITKPGDLWLLGEHRLLCGDSTDPVSVARLLDGRTPFLMVTDPPYGVEYDPEWRQEAADKGLKGFHPGRMGTVQNDERGDWTAAYELFPGHVAYVWHAGVHAGLVAANLHTAKFSIRSQIIWKKSSFAISRGHYHWQHEPCWYAVRKGGSAKWAGDRSQSTAWEIKNVVDKADNTDHGTQKPVECMARPIRNHGGTADDVYDPFLGSGTTLIAAEQLGRKCFGLEISPAYADVIVQRWEQLTGGKAVLA